MARKELGPLTIALTKNAGINVKANGFTLIELLVTLAVVIILVTIAVPGFQKVIIDSRLASDYNEILSGLNYAKSEAIKRREKVVFKVTSSSPWEYHVYRSDDSGNPLRIRSGKSQSVSLTGAELVEFNGLGRIADGTACFSGCALSVTHDSSGCRVVEISRFGRVARSKCEEEAT